jgi:polyhydroxyalkanoate synthesis regulator phasin
MALDLSKLNFFSRLNARARVMVLFIGLIGFIVLIYMATKYFSGSSRAIGPSSVASAPQGLQSVPGGKLSPEYYRALAQANAQAAQQAKMTGGSAIPTLVNIGEGTPSGNGCNIICSDQNAKVNSLLDDWVRQGKLSPDVATALEKLADQNVPVSEYAAALDQLVKEGKLTPEQARELLEQYKKQHANALLQDSAKTMDDLIKSGQLPLDVANQLLQDQKNGMTPEQYAAELQRLVKEGKISPAVAQQLLAQYVKQRAQEAAKENLATIDQMAKNGEITPAVAKDLSDLAKKNVPLDQYAAELQRLVASGQLTPVAAAKLLAAYQAQKGVPPIGPAAAGLNQLTQQANDRLKSDLSGLQPQVAQQLSALMAKNVSPADFAAAVNELVREGKLTPEQAKKLIADYNAAHGLQDLSSNLANMRANGATATDYAAALKRAVAAGLITPEQAAELMQEYQTQLQNAAAANATPGTAAVTPAFAALQARAATAANQPGGTVSPNEFEGPQVQAQGETDQERQQRLLALENAMSGQAQQLIASWAPQVMEFRAAPPPAKKTNGAGASASSSSSSSSSSTSTYGVASGGAPLIKAGTVIFAVLDTAVNSDYPDSPVMATIVEGKYKGAKLLGKLTTTKGVSGQQDRIMLNFILMNEDSWERSKNVTAYAIDPDTARSVLASDVNYHYLMKYGAIFATSFVQGYASAIQSSASTSTTGIFGTSTTHPQLSPSQKLATAIGQIGTNLGSVTQNYTNIPPTVTVDSGVSLGILFMADVA